MKYLLKTIVTILPLAVLISCGQMKPIDEWGDGVHGRFRYNPTWIQQGHVLMRKATETCELAYETQGNQHRADCLNEYNQVKHYMENNKNTGLMPEDVRDWHTAKRRLRTIYAKCDIPEN
jgi:hypothetical protein